MEGYGKIVAPPATFTFMSNFKALILSRYPRRWSASQIHPFHFYKEQLKKKFNFEFKDLPVSDLSEIDLQQINSFDVVFVQLLNSPNRQQLRGLLQKIRCKKVLLDDNPSSCQHAFSLIPFVDLYVKKQQLKKLSDDCLIPASVGNRIQRFIFYNRNHPKVRWFDKCFIYLNILKYKIFKKNIHSRIPALLPSLQEKLIAGWNIGTMPGVEEELNKPVPCLLEERPIDVSLRISLAGTRSPAKGNCYYQHRRIAMEAVLLLGKKFKVVSTVERLPEQEYREELRRSKICVSPWGYGEICFRDFEAIFCGALLVKPPTEHLISYPNIYIPHVTYVPVKPDFSDLLSVCQYYLHRPVERNKIVSAAFNTYKKYFDEEVFLTQMADILKRLMVT